ncbi:glycosyltransferase family 2 protein [Hamadaea tsunoensis]|uniref:glycosyltransferase family 2 protein n=1 Tax=Hamadaea tsunoensis TaxID=53368 RepID=UPI00042047E0|nr:glycosyltransferase family A protein [Hamadaea tsunoensis]
MSAAVTVVVPTRDTARTLAACLASIRAQTHPAVELIVVDNFSTDGTPDVAAEYADLVIHCGPERSAQRNAGLRAATGEVIAFIDADMVLEPPLLAEAVDLLGADPAPGAVVLTERSFGTGFLASCRELEKRLYIGARGVEASRVFLRAALDQVGGFDEELMAGFEDWDLDDRIAAAGYAVARTTGFVWHDEGRINLRHQFRKKRWYGRTLRAYAGRQTRRSLSPTALVSQPGLLLRRPHHAAGLAVLKGVEYAGLLAGAARRAG